MNDWTVWLDCDGAYAQRMLLSTDNAETAKDEYMKKRFPSLWKQRKTRLAGFKSLRSCLQAKAGPGNHT